MALKLFIGRTSMAPYLQAKTFDVSGQLNSRDRCAFELLDTAASYRPTVGQEVIAYDDAQTFLRGTAPGTFTRATTAYNSLGTAIASGVERYGGASANAGLVIEQAATNLLTGTASDFETTAVNISSDGTRTGAGLSTDYAYVGTQSYKAAWSAGSNNLYINNAGCFTATSSTTFTCTMYVRRADGQPVTISNAYIYTVLLNKVLTSANWTIDALSNGWYRISFWWTFASATTITLMGVMFSGLSGGAIYTDAWSAVPGLVPTSYVANAATRNLDQWTVSATTKLGTGSWTVEFDWTPTAPVGSILSLATSNTLLQIGTYNTSSSVTLFAHWNSTTGAPTLLLLARGASDGAFTVNTVVRSYATGWYVNGTKRKVAVRCTGGTTLDIFIDGVKYGSYTPTTALGAWGGAGLLRLGSNAAADVQGNAIYANLRLSDVARTDAELIACGLGTTIQYKDPNATLFCDFANALTEATAVRLFAGTIEDLEEDRFDGPRTMLRYQVEAVDYNQILDRHLVARSYTAGSQTLSTIVLDIVAQDLAGEGITTGSVATGPAVTAIQWNYMPVSKAFDDLAEVTGYAWWVDYYKVLHFQDRSAISAPSSITSSPSTFRKIKVKTSRNQYRNRQYVRAGLDLTASRTETYIGDNKTRVFPVAYPVGTVPTVTVDGVSKTVGIKGIDTGKDFYWNKGDAFATQDDAGTLLTSGNVLSVTYRGLYPLLVAQQADAEIAARALAEGGTGVYEGIVEAPDIDRSSMATDRAAGLIRRFGHIPRTVEIETDVAGFAAGQLVTITVAEHAVSGSWLIESIKAKDWDGAHLRYTLRALDGEAIGGWQNFFKALAGAGRKPVFRDNEVILLLRTIADAASASDSVVAVSAAPESRADYALADYSEAG